MGKRTNPSKRLHKIFTRIRSAVSSKNLPYSQAIHDVFKLEDGDFKQLYRYAGAIQKLVEEVEEMVLSREGINHSLYLRYFRQFKTIVYNPNMNFNLAANNITGEMMYSLEVISEELSNDYGEDELEAEGIESIIQEIEATRSKVNESEVDQALKTVLLELLMMMRESIHEYEVSGARGIQEAVVICYGRIIKLWNNDKQLAEKEGGLGVFDLIKKLDVVSGAALKVKVLGSDLLSALNS